MKKYFKLTVCILLCVTIAMFSACGSASKPTEEKPDYCDKAFLADLKKGLQARWDVILDDEEDENYVKSLRLGVNAELDAVSKYTNATFEDNKLKEKAITYINLLNDQLNALSYINSDYQKYLDLWSNAYDERSKIINELVTNYGLSFDEKYKDSIDELTNNSKAVLEQEETDNKIQEMVNNLDFKTIENLDGWKTYSAIIENTSGIDFGALEININLLDKDGIIIESTEAWVNNFAKGKKAKVEFSTDKEFVSTESTVGYYE